MPETATTPTDRWLTLAEATSLGYGGNSTLRRYIKLGRLPSAGKRGRAWCVRRSELDDVIAQNRGPATFDEVEAAVSALVAQAPPLTDYQMRRLAAVLGDAAS